MVMVPNGNGYSLQKLEAPQPNPANKESVDFFNAMQELFKSEEFKQAGPDLKVRRELIGNCIYETIERLIGEDAAPKVTGMIIDLSFPELIPTVSTLEALTVKAKDAFNLLQQLKAQANQAT